MLCRLYYLMCDDCGALSSDGEDTGKEARRLARRAKWGRKPRRQGGANADDPQDGADYCPKCAPAHKEAVSD